MPSNIEELVISFQEKLAYGITYKQCCKKLNANAQLMLIVNIN